MSSYMQVASDVVEVGMSNRGIHSRSEWVRLAALRLMALNVDLTAWDAVVISMALAERANWLATEPDLAVEKAFDYAEREPSSAQSVRPEHPNSG